MKYKIRISAILALFLFIPLIMLNSCKSKDEGEFEELSISIDKTRIGDEFIDMNLKFKFNPPKGWMLKPSELTEKIVSRQRSDKETGDSFIYKPLYIFFSDSTKGILTIGTVERNDSLKTPVQIQRYQNELVARYGKNNVAVKNYIKDKLILSQLTIEKQSIVTRKIIFSNADNRFIQFEYTLQKNVKDTEDEAIQSSLGTLVTVK